MKYDLLEKAIYEKYIEPTRQKRKRSIGIEIELPIVNLGNKPVDEGVVLAMAETFCDHFGFKGLTPDANGHIYSMENEQNGDNLSFDSSYTNLEFSLGKGNDLYEIKKRFDAYYIFVNELLSKYDYTLTGMGINPNYNINNNKPIPNERYRMLDRYLRHYDRYSTTSDNRQMHRRTDFGYFTSASQVQLDVDYEELVDVLNIFGKLEPYKVLLFANSWIEEWPRVQCARNLLWENSMQGYNPHNVGMYDIELTSIEDIMEYIKSQSMYSIMRDGKWVNFEPIPLLQFFNKELIKGEYFNGEGSSQMDITPELHDLTYHRTFKFEDLTFRGTVEFRSACSQPVKDSMTVAAFHLGLIGRLAFLKEFLEHDRIIYSHGYRAAELQHLFSQLELPDFVDTEELSKALVTILDIAAEGLRERGYGEDVFLNPLYDRARHLTNPAKRMLEGIEHGKSMKYFIKEYSVI